MTRERAKELLPVITAFAEGKEVEYQSGTGDWTENPSPSWSEHCQYRIKPEPRLRPWKPEEVPVGAVVRAKSDRSVKRLILHVVESVNGGVVSVGGLAGFVTVHGLLESYELLDGKPCGVLEPQP